MVELRKTKENLPKRINDAVDAAAEVIVRTLCDDYSFHKPHSTHRHFSELALEMTGITGSRLAWLSENDDHNPQYELYYANLSALCVKAAARAADKLCH